jgi:hypothetical protein
VRFGSWPFHHRRRALMARRLWSPGAIPWGTDLSTLAPTILNANADVTLTAGAATTAIHSQSGGTGVPLIQTNAFDVYPIIIGSLTILMGATAPSALVISYATTAGTAISSFTVAPALLVNAATVQFPFFLIGPLSSTLYTGAGKDPLIQVNPTGQNCTLKAVGSQALFQLALGVE